MRYQPKLNIEKYVIDILDNKTQTQWLVQEETGRQHMPWKTIAVFNDEHRALQYVRLIKKDAKEAQP